ncbi:MAG: aminoglycoside phosphotransferase, partial [Mesorhizobium sp.]
VDILSRQLQRKATPSTWRKVDADRKLADIAAELASVSDAAAPAQGTALKTAS